MEVSLNDKKEQKFSTIFSKIDETLKSKRYSIFQNNLSKLQQSVSLLSFYGTKGKINAKKAKKLMSSPKVFETEPN